MRTTPKEIRHRAAPLAGKTAFGGKLNSAMHSTTDEQERQQRELGLLCLTAKTLVHIDATLTDLQTLAQQQADLLRAILTIERSAQ